MLLVIRTRATTSRRAGTIKRARMQITHTFDYLRWNCAKILSTNLLTWRDIVAGQCCLLLANCNISNCERGARVHPSSCCGVAVIVAAVIISALAGNYPCNGGTCNGDISLNNSFRTEVFKGITFLSIAFSFDYYRSQMHPNNFGILFIGVNLHIPCVFLWPWRVGNCRHRILLFFLRLSFLDLSYRQQCFTITFSSNGIVHLENDSRAGIYFALKKLKNKDTATTEFVSSFLVKKPSWWLCGTAVYSV